MPWVRLAVFVVVALVVAVSTPGGSEAVPFIPQLRVDDGVNPVVTISDNGVGDSNAAAGVILYTGTFGSLLVNVDTAITKPVYGTAGAPKMDLNFVFVSTAPITLKLSFTDGDFSAVGSWSAHIGGTPGGGTVNYKTYLDPANAPFGTTILLVDSGILSGLAYSFDGQNPGPLGGSSYSLTQLLTITCTAACTSSGNAELIGTPVPEPTTLLLLGTGLVAAGAWGRKLTRRKTGA